MTSCKSELLYSKLSLRLKVSSAFSNISHGSEKETRAHSYNRSRWCTDDLYIHRCSVRVSIQSSLETEDCMHVTWHLLLLLSERISRPCRRSWKSWIWMSSRRSVWKLSSRRKPIWASWKMMISSISVNWELETEVWLIKCATNPLAS